jgi:hypothetical protein
MIDAEKLPGLRKNRKAKPRLKSRDVPFLFFLFSNFHKKKENEKEKMKDTKSKVVQYSHVQAIGRNTRKVGH